MDEALKRELEAAGFEVGTIEDFLNLTDEDMEVVALRLMAHRLLKALRKALRERDEAKRAIGDLGEVLERAIEDSTKLKLELSTLRRNYSNAIGPR